MFFCRSALRLNQTSTQAGLFIVPPSVKEASSHSHSDQSLSGSGSEQCDKFSPKPEVEEKYYIVQQSSYKDFPFGYCVMLKCLVIWC